MGALEGDIYYANRQTYTYNPSEPYSFVSSYSVSLSIKLYKNREDISMSFCFVFPMFLKNPGLTSPVASQH